MIGVLTALAEARCNKCDGKITQYRSDIELGADWYHETNGSRFCPGAPTAWPVEATIVDLTTPFSPGSGDPS